LLEAATAHKDVLTQPPAIAVFEDYGDSALIFDLFFWSRALGERELRLIRSDIRFAINELFREHGIVIAFPQRDVHLYRHDDATSKEEPS
jgi:small-conductance mechanosensitive channel